MANTVADLKNALATADPASAVPITVSGATLSLVASDLDQALSVPAPGVAYQAWVIVPSLHFRQSPGLAGPIIRSLMKNEQIAVLNVLARQVDGYLWVLARDSKGIMGWCDQEFLTRTPPPPPPAPKPTSLIGLHFLEDAATQANQFLASGARLASATVVDNVALANTLAQSVPYVLFRRWPDDQGLQIPDDLTAAEAYGRQWVTHRFAADSNLGAADTRVYLDMVNEVPWSPGHPGFWLGVLKQLSAMGRKGAFGCYGVGYPEPAQWATAIAVLEFAKANGHVVCLHSYCAPGTPIDQLSADSADYELRFIRLANAVPDSARPTLIIGEAAHEFSRGLFEGADHLVKFAQLFQAAVRLCTYVGGFNLWTCGSFGGWGTSDITPALPALETAIKGGA